MPRNFRFILCADDFALSPAVSAGILEALEAGALSATGVMTNRPFWRTDAKALAPYAGRADLGLHFNLTLGAPLAALPALAPAGELPRLRALMAGAWRGTLPEAEIRAEISAQIDAFSQILGRAPDFVDGHQHVHVLPGIRQWLFEALGKRGLAGKLWLRNSGDHVLSILARTVQIPKAVTVSWLSRGFSAEAAAHGFARNDGFAGFSAFDPARDYGADFASYLKRPGQRHLVMCHPGHVDAELARLDPATASRERELAFLLSPQFRKLLADAGAEVSRFSQL